MPILNQKSLTTTNTKNENPKDSDSACKSLIPGLPDDVASLCLLHIPYPYESKARLVSSSWNKLFQDPSFFLSKISLSLSLPYLFLFSFHKTTLKSQWQALDLRSNSWFLLPPMPSSSSATNPPAFAFTSLPRQGKIFVLGGMKTHTQTHSNSPPDSDPDSLVMNSVMMYQTSTNKWSTLSPMKVPRAFLAACAAVTSSSGDVKIIAAGGCGPDDLSTVITNVECYDAKTNTWHPGAEMPSRLVQYDSAVVGNRVYITEGWSWPFMFTPRGVVYDPEEDHWREMSAGMREGWTGIGVVVVVGVGEKKRERLVVISEHGDHRLKVYLEDGDRWEYVGGERFPNEVLKKPFVACGDDEDGRRIYVVGSGLHVGIGRFFDGEKEGELWVEWVVIAPPKACQDFSPCNSQLLYA